MSTFVSLHAFSAFLSLTLLIIRGVMQLGGKDWRAIKLLKILPHLSDTLLIASGLYVFLSLGYSLQPWHWGKFALVLLYVFFAAKYFTKKSTKPKAFFLVLAALSLSGAMLLGFYN